MSAEQGYPSPVQRLVRLLNPANDMRIIRVFIIPWLLNLYNQRHYTLLSEAALRATRRGDTIFIFGSGYSINEITEPEWHHFEQHDTLSFNWFPYQNHVRADYHLIREICIGTDNPSIWKTKLGEYSRLLAENPRYDNTIFLVHAGIRATMANRIIGLKQLQPGARVFRFRNPASRGIQQPSPSLSKGLSHDGTLSDCVNFAYLMGWKRIVLVGVDLYDRRYFWLRYEETRDRDLQRAASHQDRHNVADTLITMMGMWRRTFAEHGVELHVYNPRSLLTQVLPVYRAQEH
jgi:hypothetical protein